MEFHQYLIITLIPLKEIEETIAEKRVKTGRHLKRTR